MRKSILLDKIYFCILSFLSFLILFISAEKNQININIILFSSLLIITLLFLCYIFYFVEKLEYYPINILFNLYILITLLFFMFKFNAVVEEFYPIIFGSLDGGEYNIDRNIFIQLSEKAIKIILLSVLFFNTGFFLAIKFFKKKFNFLPNIDELQLLRLIFFLLICKLALIIFSLIERNIEQLSNPISILLCTISFYLLIHSKNNRLINFIIIFYIFIENFVLTFGIIKNIILLIIFIIIFYNFKKKISFILLIFLFSWIILGQSYKVPIREYFYLADAKINKLMNSKINTDEEKSQALINEEIPISTDFNTRSIYLRGVEPMISLIRILEFDEILKKPIQKDTLSIIMYSTIPRFILPDKPKQDYAKWYTDHFFNIYDVDEIYRNQVTYNIPWTSDFFINFKYMGSIFLSLFIGFILGLLSIYFTNFNSNNIHFLLGVSILSGMSLPDYNFSMMFSPLILQYLIIFSIIKLILIIQNK